MQRLTINVPDNKVQFFKELIESLGFTYDNTSWGVLPLVQEICVTQELNHARQYPESLLNWDEEQHKIDWDAC